VAVDNPNSAEAVEGRDAVETPQPPPPDRPGAEGFPSRAESRAAAAAAPDDGPRPSDEPGDDTPPDTSSAGPADDDRGGQAAADTSDSEHDRSPDGQEPRREEPEGTRTDDGGTDQSPSSEQNTPDAPGETESEDLDLSETSVPIEAADQPDLQQEDVRQEEIADSARGPADAPGEAAEEPHPDGDPGPETVAPSADESADPHTDSAQAAGGPEAVDSAPGQVVVADQPYEPPDDLHDPRPGSHLEEEQPVDDVLPVAEAEPVDESAAADPDTIPHSGDGSTEGTEPTAEPLADGIESEGEGGTHTGEPSGEDDDWDFDFTVNEKYVRARAGLNPVRAEDWSNEVGDQIPDPAERKGDRIVNETDDKASRRERMRREGYKATGEVRDGIRKVADQSKALKRPPTGNPETRICPPATGSEARAGDHQGLDVGNAVTAGLAAGVLIGELIHFVGGKLENRKGRR
jgi:hypothetical protein